MGSCIGCRLSSTTGHGCPNSDGLDEKSGMTGDCHVPFCGSPGVRSPWATRRAPLVSASRPCTGPWHRRIHQPGPDSNRHSGGDQVRGLRLGVQNGSAHPRQTRRQVVHVEPSLPTGGQQFLDAAPVGGSTATVRKLLVKHGSPSILSSVQSALSNIENREEVEVVFACLGDWKGRTLVSPPRSSHASAW